MRRAAAKLPIVATKVAFVEKDALARAGCPTGGGLAGRREAPDEGVVWGAEVSTGWGTARRYRVAEGAREKGGRRLL